MVSSADVDSPATLDTELTVPATGDFTEDPTDSDSSFVIFSFCSAIASLLAQREISTLMLFS